MFIKTVTTHRAASASEHAGIGASRTSGPEEGEFVFNIKRLVVAAVLLVVILVFAIGTAFFDQLAQIHTMLVHAFELVLGLIAGLLGGEAIAKAEKG